MDGHGVVTEPSQKRWKYCTYIILFSFSIIHFSQSKINQSEFKQLAIVALETFNQAFLIKNSSPFLSGIIN